MLICICNRLHKGDTKNEYTGYCQKKVGVSSATVSRVINQSGYVKDETKQKVLAAIEEADFVPNAIARSLSTRDSSSIGVIVPDIANEFFFQCYKRNGRDSGQ